MKYSPSTNGFYLASIHGAAMPVDVLDITDEEHAALLEGQSRGLAITPGAGGKPESVEPPVPPLETRKALLLARVDVWLNAAAQARGYDDIWRAALRAGWPGPYHAEGVAFATWMDEVYASCYSLLAQFEAGALPEPTADELLSMLPALVLPAVAI